MFPRFARANIIDTPIRHAIACGESRRSLFCCANIGSVGLRDFSSVMGRAFYWPLEREARNAAPLVPTILTIVAMRACKKMGWVAAYGIVAFVQGEKAVKRAIHALISNAVDIVTLPAKCDAAVSPLLSGAWPWPTFVEGPDLYPRPQGAWDGTIALRWPRPLKTNTTARTINHVPLVMEEMEQVNA